MISLSITFKVHRRFCKVILEFSLPTLRYTLHHTNTQNEIIQTPIYNLNSHNITQKNQIYYCNVVFTVVVLIPAYSLQLPSSSFFLFQVLVALMSRLLSCFYIQIWQNKIQTFQSNHPYEVKLQFSFFGNG